MTLVLIIALLITYISANDITTFKTTLKGKDAYIDYLKGRLQQSEFVGATASMQCDDYELTIQDKDELIWSLQAEVVLATDRSKLDRGILEYCLAYIQYMQVLAYSEGIEYPEFVVDSVLDDNYFEELKNQVEFFEDMGE